MALFLFLCWYWLDLHSNPFTRHNGKWKRYNIQWKGFRSNWCGGKNEDQIHVALMQSSSFAHMPCGYAGLFTIHSRRRSELKNPLKQLDRYANVIIIHWMTCIRFDWNLEFSMNNEHGTCAMFHNNFNRAFTVGHWQPLFVCNGYLQSALECVYLFLHISIWANDGETFEQFHLNNSLSNWSKHGCSPFTCINIKWIK